MALSAFELLDTQLREEKQISIDAVLSGRVNDFSGYKFLCGQIHALTVAQQLVKELEERMQRENDM